MAFLAQNSAAGVPVTSSKTKVKFATLEIYASVTCNYRGIEYKNGILALLTGQQMLKTRANPDNDKTLGWISGFIANNQAAHPAFEKDFF